MLDWVAIYFNRKRVAGIVHEDRLAGPGVEKSTAHR